MKFKDMLTTALEILGLLAILAGVYLLWGLAVALIVAGVFAIGTSFLLIRGGHS